MFILIVCDDTVEGLYTFKYLSQRSLLVGLGRCISIRTGQRVGGSNPAEDIHFHLEFFAPFPFLTARRSPYK